MIFSMCYFPIAVNFPSWVIFSALSVMRLVNMCTCVLYFGKVGYLSSEVCTFTSNWFLQHTTRFTLERKKRAKLGQSVQTCQTCQTVWGKTPNSGSVFPTGTPAIIPIVATITLERFSKQTIHFGDTDSLMVSITCHISQILFDVW